LGPMIELTPKFAARGGDREQSGHLKVKGERKRGEIQKDNRHPTLPEAERTPNPNRFRELKRGDRKRSHIVTAPACEYGNTKQALTPKDQRPGGKGNMFGTERQ